MKEWIAAVVVILALTYAVYGQVGSYEFLNYDDDVYITANPNVQAGLTAESVRWAFTTSRSGNWHPLTWLAHMLDFELFGLEPAGHHQVSAALHGINAVLLLLALRAMGCVFWPSVFVAAVFAVHPLRVESVAWVAERKDVLSGLFFMITLLAWAWYARRPGVLRYACVAVALALGLLAKPMLVTVPCLLLLLDRWPLARWRSSNGDAADGPPRFPAMRAPLLVLEKLPLLALSAVSSWMTFRHQRVTGAVLSEEVISQAACVSNAAVSVLRYLGDTLAPNHLACFYPHPALIHAGTYTPWSAPALAALVVVVTLTLGAFLVIRRAPELSIGWWWTVGMLVPVIGLLPVGEQSHADRYTYLPLIGFTVGVAFFSWRGVAGSRAGRAAWITVAAASVLVLTGLGRRQAAVWHDSMRLFEHAIEVTEGNYVAHHNIGSLLVERGQLAAAEERYQEALRINPRFADAQCNLGRIAFRRRDTARAIEHFERCLELRPGQVDGHRDVARLLAQRGEYARAARHLKLALAYLPGDVGLWRELADALSRSGDLFGARRALATLARLQPESPDVQADLGEVALRQGDLDAAESYLARALALSPHHPKAHGSLGVLFQRRGDAWQAIFHLRAALRAQPPPLPTANLLARMLATAEDPELRDGEEALRLARLCVAGTRQQNALYLDTLAAAHAELGRFEDAIRLQELAIERVDPAGRDEFGARLGLYRSERPYRERIGP